MPRKQSTVTSQIISLAASAGANGITASELIQAIPNASPAQIRSLLKGLLNSRSVRATNRCRRSVNRTCMFNTVYEIVQNTTATVAPTVKSKTTKAVAKRGRPTEAVRQKRIRDAIALLKKAGIKKVA